VNKENGRSIDRTADLTCLTWEQVLRAMSNERRRLKAEGSTAAELKVIKKASELSKQLKDLRKSLQDWIDEDRFPSGLDNEVEEVADMMVCNAVTS
jgi:hypothetical protein